MKNFTFTASVICLLSAGQFANAATIDAVSYVTVDHRFNINGGTSPDGVSAHVSGPTFLSDIAESQIDDLTAGVVIDETNVQVGLADPDDPIPFVYNQQHRRNRPDPTQFADAQKNIRDLTIRDTGADVTYFAIGSQHINRDGLAQLRLQDPLVAASAVSSYGASRTLTLENTNDHEVSFGINGAIDASLLSRFSGDGGLARTSTTVSMLFSGLSYDQLEFFDTGSTPARTNLTGDGASLAEGLFTTDDGTLGIIFTAGATAIGDGGFTEADLDVSHLYRLFMTLEAGQSTEIEIAYRQSNFVDYTPLAPVPLPAGGLLLAASLSVLGLRKFIST